MTIVYKPAYYHLWFIYTIIGLYILTPVLRLAISKIRLKSMFIVLIFWFLALFTYRYCIAFCFTDNDLSTRPFIGFLAYYILGYYLAAINLNKKNLILTRIVTILSFPFTILSTYFLTLNNNGIYINYFSSHFSPNIFIMSIGVFLLFNNCSSNSFSDNKITKTLNLISSNSYFIYLVHVFIIELLLLTSIATELMSEEYFNPIFSIPLLSIIVFCFSLLLSLLSIKSVKLIKNLLAVKH